LFRATPAEHLALAKHLTAEVKTEEFVAGKGVVTKWERIRRQNHWLDALYNASALASYCGIRLIEGPSPPPQKKVVPTPPRSLRRDGGPWIDAERFRRNWDRITGR
jgi:hypothetical protein